MRGKRRHARRDAGLRCRIEVQPELGPPPQHVFGGACPLDLDEALDLGLEQAAEILAEAALEQGFSGAAMRPGETGDERRVVVFEPPDKLAHPALERRLA